jgi:hypothetical protein
MQEMGNVKDVISFLVRSVMQTAYIEVAQCGLKAVCYFSSLLGHSSGSA